MKKKLIIIALLSCFILSSIASAGIIQSGKTSELIVSDETIKNKIKVLKVGAPIEEVLETISTQPDYDEENDILSTLNDPNELTCNGIDWKAWEHDDVQPYGEYAVRLGEDPAIDEGIVYYLFYLGNSVVVKDGMEIGLYFCDRGIFGNGPSLFILDMNTVEYECIANNMGDNDDMEWKWVSTQNSNKYIDDQTGLIMLMVVGEGLDDTILQTIGVRYDLEKEPEFVYDPFVGYMAIDPGNALEIPPYSSVSLTVKPNPYFAGQNIVIPHGRAKIQMHFFAHIVEDMPHPIIYEDWVFELNPDDNLWSTWIWWRDSQPDDDAGLCLFSSSEKLPVFSQGFKTYSFKLRCEYSHWVKIDNKTEPMDWWSKSADAGTVRFEIINNPPNAPNLDGPHTIKINCNEKFTAKTTDPDGDDIEYGWDWNNDGTVDKWTSATPSGESSITEKSWAEVGTYTIKVKARDTHFKDKKLESDWSEPLTIQVQLSRSSNNYVNQVYKLITGRFSLFQRLLHGLF